MAEHSKYIFLSLDAMSVLVKSLTNYAVPGIFLSRDQKWEKEKNKLEVGIVVRKRNSNFADNSILPTIPRIFGKQ